MKNKNETWLLIKKTWKYIKRAKGNLVGYCIVSLLEAVISVFIPLISAKVILNITDGMFEQLIITAIVVFALEFFLHICYYFKILFYRKIFAITVTKLKMDVASSTLKLAIKEIDNKSSGVFIDRLNNDTEEISGVFMEFSYWLSYVITNFGVLFTIFFLNKYIFVFSLISSIFTFLIYKKGINKEYKMHKELKKFNEKTTSLTSEVVRGIRDIKVLNARKNVLNELEKRVVDARNERDNLMKNKSFYEMIESDLRLLTNLIFIIFGVYLCNNNLLSIPSFVILYNYQPRVRDLWNGIASLSEYLKKFSLSASRIYEIIDSDTFEKEKFGNNHINNILGNIEFKNVSFQYEKGNKVLDNLSFKIKENQTVAIVGKSGVGKTTIFSLLASLYQPNKGSILIDGTNIRELDESSIRDNIAIITQNPYIFNFSIKENLLLTSPLATDEEIKEACRIASLDDFIQSLKDKYDTVVGEGGVYLSGGQKQRLAIARALLMKTKIILFDEATSALDNETQEHIQKSIQQMKGNYTIVIVAHRLSTIIDADNIIVIDDGHVVATGTHKKLLKTSKIYKKLYNKEII